MWQEVFGLRLNTKLIKVSLPVRKMHTNVSQKLFYYLFNIGEFLEMRKKKTACGILVGKTRRRKSTRKTKE
jgi:hypothetical protein